MRTPVGDRYVVEHMRKHGFNVGGEQSGHIVLSDFSTTGDGLVAALQVLAVVVDDRHDRQRGLPTASSRCRSSSRTCATPTASRWRTSASSRPSTPARRKLGEYGRLVIRPSGTEPVIRVMAEGDDERLVKTVVGDIVDAVRAAAAA